MLGLEFIEYLFAIMCYNNGYRKALQEWNPVGLLINNSLLGVIMTTSNNTRYIERGQHRMPLLYSTEQIVERFKEKHGNKYDYSLVEYKGADCRVSIICKTHGVFNQRSDGHADGNDCPKCAKRYKPSTTEFIAECLDIHGDYFDYRKTTYKNTRTKVMVGCKSHGDFLVRPMLHRDSPTGGCPECRTNKAVKIIDFVERSNVAHGNKYSYAGIKELKNTRQKVLVSCAIHGDFLQIADQHLHGRGCPSCGKEIAHGFSRTSYIKMCEKSNAGNSSLYIIACEGNGESFFKVGITSTSLKRRFNSVIPYEYKQVCLVEGEAGFIWDLEVQIHRLVRKHAYQPLLSFGGESECFVIIPKGVINLMSQFNSTQQIQLIA